MCPTTQVQFFALRSTIQVVNCRDNFLLLRFTLGASNCFFPYFKYSQQGVERGWRNHDTLPRNGHHIYQRIGRVHPVWMRMLGFISFSKKYIYIYQRILQQPQQRHLNKRTYVPQSTSSCGRFGRDESARILTLEVNTKTRRATPPGIIKLLDIHVQALGTYSNACTWIELSLPEVNNNGSQTRWPTCTCTYWPGSCIYKMQANQSSLQGTVHVRICRWHARISRTRGGRGWGRDKKNSIKWTQSACAMTRPGDLSTFPI